MEKMTFDKMKEIKGGGINLGLVAGIGAALSLLVGIIDGIMNPSKCNN